MNSRVEGRGSRSGSPFTVLAALAAWLLLAVPALAQAPNNAAIVVVVSDPSGAVVADARVTVVNTSTGAAREAASGQDGSATVTALPVTGTYDVTVSKNGFAPQSVSGIALRAGETAEVRIALH